MVTVKIATVRPSHVYSSGTWAWLMTARTTCISIFLTLP